jgi:tRNA(Arg) A34 adenosine deaminase TadA
MESDPGFQVALSEARNGLADGGIPIGACLVAADGTILGRGRNLRMQKGSPTLHVCMQLVSAVSNIETTPRAFTETKNKIGRNIRFGECW